MAKKQISQKLLIAKKMPPLNHRNSDADYDVSKSKVVEWLIEQPDLLQWFFESMKDKELIKYNSDTGKWQGVDFD